jgi:hypothetical protein
MLAISFVNLWLLSTTECSIAKLLALVDMKDLQLLIDAISLFFGKDFRIVSDLGLAQTRPRPSLRKLGQLENF